MSPRRRPPAGPPRRPTEARNISTAPTVLAGIAALLALLVAGWLVLGPGRPAQRLRELRPFAADAVWNAPLGARAPLAADSAELVAALQAQLPIGNGPWINTTSYSVPVYTVGRDEPTVPVVLDVAPGGDATRLAARLRAGVPIPPGARPSPGSDAQLVVWQPSRNRMWELWHAGRRSGNWHARWGGVMDDVSANPGYFDDPRDWGATATSLPLLGGLIRISELRAGVIPHALALAVPQARAGSFVWPAQRSDGVARGARSIPEGTRFRLPAGLDLASLHLPHLDLVLARAAQRYGMIVRDQAGAVVFYAEDPSQLRSDPYTGPHGLFSGRSPAELLRAFPWKRLEVVAPRQP